MALHCVHRTTPQSAIGNHQGFTLLEVLIVVAVLGIVAAVTVPAFQRLETRDELVGAADEVVRLLRGARLAALERGRPVEVIVDPSQGRYWVWEGSALNALAEARFEFGAGVTLESAEPRARFAFRPVGAPTSDELVVRRAGRSLTVTLDRWTGDPIVHGQ